MILLCSIIYLANFQTTSQIDLVYDEHTTGSSTERYEQSVSDLQLVYPVKGENASDSPWIVILLTVKTTIIEK